MPEAVWWHSYGAWFFWAAVCTVLLLLIVIWIRISASSGTRSRDAAERVLALRYLSGEIDKREYKRKLAALRRLRSRA